MDGVSCRVSVVNLFMETNQITNWLDEKKKSKEVQVAGVRCRPPSKLALASRRTPSMPPPRYKLYTSLQIWQGIVNSGCRS
jgi:hypothetical protein